MPGNYEFHEVFGFRPPTEQELETVAEAIAFKINNNGDPVGMQALLSVPGAEEVAGGLIDLTATSIVERGDVDAETAHALAFGGFLFAVELIAGIRLATED